jgi:hypothetical protein
VPVLCVVRKSLLNAGRWARWGTNLNGEPVLCAVRKWPWNAGRWAYWSTKVNGEPVWCAARKWLWNAGRWARWSTKLNDETRRLGHSAKRSAAVRGQAGRGATVAGRHRPGAAEPIVEIFCLPGFVADRGPICSSRGSPPHFSPHVRDPSLSLASLNPRDDAALVQSSSYWYLVLDGHLSDFCCKFSVGGCGKNDFTIVSLMLERENSNLVRVLWVGWAGGGSWSSCFGV